MAFGTGQRRDGVDVDGRSQVKDSFNGLSRWVHCNSIELELILLGWKKCTMWHICSVGS